MQFQIKKRFSLELMYTETIEADETTPENVKLGRAIRAAYLRGADLRGADLGGAYLRGADLRGAYLRGADLRGAKSIVSFGPVGNEGRIGYAVKHEKCVMISLGCFWGTDKEAIKKINTKYKSGSAYALILKAAVKVLTEKK